MIAGAVVARCPGKVNLALRVLGVREDGYHELDTIFQAIDLWDEIGARPAPDLTLSCDRPGLPTDDTNLVLRAAELMRERFDVGDAGAALVLRKAIPPRSGLGGGSSDAAGAMLLLRKLWDLPASAEDLIDLGARLGADVPFFLHGGTARGRGRGDRVEPLPFVGELPLLLGIPPFGISTARVFAEVRDRLTLPRNGVSVPLFSSPKWPEGNDFHFAVNDLETVVFETWPELERFRDALWGAGARSALLSGSGSVVYGIFEDPGALSRAECELQGRFERWTLMRTRAVERAAHVTSPGD
jgi:4-diphosphocytidyl-2-C-methyl-D-erythritol kinase